MGKLSTNLISNSKKLKSYKLQANKGFTIVELLVSVAIFVIITSIILAKHSKFSGTLLLENLAYDIALTIRKAQVFGLSIKESGPGVFDSGYGVHFNNQNNNSYIFFKDENKNKKYDGSSEALETFTLGSNNIISKFCGIIVSGTEKCSISEIAYLDIVFERPNPDAIIKSDIIADTYGSAQITILSPDGAEWKVEIVTTGQISIHK